MPHQAPQRALQRHSHSPQTACRMCGRSGEARQSSASYADIGIRPIMPNACLCRVDGWPADGCCRMVAAVRHNRRRATKSYSPTAGMGYNDLRHTLHFLPSPRRSSSAIPLSVWRRFSLPGRGSLPRLLCTPLAPRLAPFSSRPLVCVRCLTASRVSPWLPLWRSPPSDFCCHKLVFGRLLAL